MNDFAKNIEEINARIAKACKNVGREPEEVKLVAVSKQQPDSRIQQALDAGHRLFGENRVQEAQAHWETRREAYPDLRLHLIGPLQTNKVRDAVALFDCIETIDRPRLVDALIRESTKQGRSLRYFVQVNTGDEPQKAGVSPSGLEALLAHCDKKGLPVSGLMCIPPLEEPPALHFALLKKLAGRYGLDELSMGMSADFEKAIALGATSIRVGSALFGDRPRTATK